MCAQLKDRLLEQIDASPQPGQAQVEMLSWLSRVTLDIIGLTGFGYSFDALKFGEESNELGYAFAQIFNTAKSTSIFSTLLARTPILHLIVRLFIVLPYISLFNSTVLVSRCVIDDRSTIQDDYQSSTDHETNWPPARA